jgi:hypothetical protein
MRIERMLTKIQDGFYIDFENISVIDKINPDIRIFFKDNLKIPVTMRANTKMAKMFFHKLDFWLGEL